MMRSFFGKKLNKKGFTLVEMILALAILALVGIVIGGFISMSSKTYKEANINIEMSQDAQQAMNQIKNVIMEANSGIAMINDASGKYLVIYNMEEIPGVSGGESIKKYNVVKIECKNDSLFYGEASFTALSAIDVSAIVSDNLMAKNISDFNVDTTKVESNDIATVLLDFDADGQTYSVTNKVTLRNKIIASSDKDVIYSGARVERSNVVKGVKLIYMNADCTNQVFDWDRPNSAQQFAFRAEVEAYGYYGTAVDWSISGATKSTISDGILTLSPEEEGSVIFVTATSKADNTVAASCRINVIWGFAKTVDIVKESERVTVSNIAGSYATYVFNANVDYNDINKVDSSLLGYEWDITPAAGSNLDGITTIISGGKLTVNCSYQASGKKFNVVAVAKCPGQHGATIMRSQEYTLSALTGPGEANVGDPVISWGGSTTLNRNHSYEIPVSASELTGVTYSWSISGAPSGVELQNAGSNSSKAILYIAPDVNWDGTYSPKVTVTVRGTRNDGAELTYSSEKTFSIKPVELTVTTSPADTITVSRKTTFITYRHFTGSFSIYVSASNIDDYASMCTATFYLGSTSCGSKKLNSTSYTYSFDEEGWYDSKYPWSTGSLNVVMSYSSYSKSVTKNYSITIK